MKKNFVGRIFEFINNKRITTVAGAWVYYFLMALVPFVFLIVTAFGVFGNKEDLQGKNLQTGL